MLRKWRFISLVAGAVACAPHHPTPAPVPAASTERLKETYACVVDAIADAGYDVRTFEMHGDRHRLESRLVSGQLISQSTPMGAGAQDLQPGFGEKSTIRQRADAGTGYSIDKVSASAKIDPASGRIVVVAGASAGVSAGTGGYYVRGATARGLSAVTHARSCGETTGLVSNSY